MNEVPCASPLSDPVLVEYWVGELPAAEEAQVEAHVFGCDACHARAQALAHLAHRIGQLSHRPPLRGVIPRALLDRWIADGLHVRIFEVRTDEPVHCFVEAGDDLLVGRLSADLSGVRRVDLVVSDEHQQEGQRFEDVPADRARGEVLVARQGAHARTLPSTIIRLNLLSVDETGERPLGSYTLLHRAYDR